MVNIGSLDRALRFALGAALVVAAFLPALEGLGAWRFVLAGLGVVAVVTAALRICPAYILLGVRSCAAEKPRA